MIVARFGDTAQRNGRGSPESERNATDLFVTSVLRIIWGFSLVLIPRVLFRTFVGSEPDRGTLIIMRVLGVRQILQGIVVHLFPNRRVIVLSATTDGLHALSMVALGIWSRHYKRAAFTDSVVASTFATLGLRSL